MNRVIALFLLISVPSLVRADDAAPAYPPAFYLEDGDRVVLLGGTIIEREQVYGEWELMLTCLYADADFTVRNLGWSGDTVWAESRGIFDPPEVGYQRMIDQIRDLNPTVVLLAYGHNEAWAGETGLEPFIMQYEKLIDDIQAATEEETRYLILLPHPHLDVGGELPDPAHYNNLLPTYVAAIEEMANSRKIPQVSLHQNRTMRQFGTWSQLSIFARDDASVSPDGVQFNQQSYEFIAQELASQLAALSHSDSSSFAYVDVEPSGPIFYGFEFEVLALDPNSGAFTAHCTRDNLAQRGVALIPFPNIGGFSLWIDGEDVGAITGDGGSVTLAVYGADFLQREALRQAIIRKNELYFHRWRPQNVTYLFGFRAHEQGNNAGEIPQFDPLIEEQEALIRQLKHPVEHVWELAPAE